LNYKYLLDRCFGLRSWDKCAGTLDPLSAVYITFVVIAMSRNNLFSSNPEQYPQSHQPQLVNKAQAFPSALRLKSRSTQLPAFTQEPEPDRSQTRSQKRRRVAVAVCCPLFRVTLRALSYLLIRAVLQVPKEEN
jgi:hypothetical protein